MSICSYASIWSASSPVWRKFPDPKTKITSRVTPCLVGRSTNQTPLCLKFNSLTSEALSKRSVYSYSRTKLRFCVRAGNNGENDLEEEELRGKSTMPDRFKYLTKELPSPPIRWPWFIALPFVIYAWRSVLWELSNWQKLLLGIFRSVGYLMKFILALIFRFIGDPISYTILFVETAVYAIRDLYSSIVTSAPIPELTFIIMLASFVLAIGEAAAPNSINCQPYMLTFAGIIGYGAVKGVIIEPFFWLMLVGIFSFSRLFKKRNYVSSALPVATVLASVGEPWIRVLAIISFTMLAIHHHSKDAVEENKEAEVSSSGVKVPLPLLGAALAIGICAFAKWAGYRHLTWMIV